jgi:hypothetical protein
VINGPDMWVPTLSSKTEIARVVRNLPLLPGDYFVRLKVMRFGEQLDVAERAFGFTVTDADTFGDG